VELMHSNRFRFGQSIYVLALAPMVLFSTSPSIAQPFRLVEAGGPTVTIVIAEKSSENAQLAAKEFQKYIEKISGAKLPIASDAEATAGPLVLIGGSKLTDRITEIKIPSGRTKNLREEGFIIFCRSNRLVLAGNDQEPYYGTRYAVAEMLHRLGVRWFMPGKFGEVVLHQSTLEISPMSIRQQPDFAMRNFWEHARGNMGDELLEWKIRHKMNPRMQDWF